MYSIIDYFSLSNPQSKINEPLNNPEELLKIYSELHVNEKESFLRYYLINSPSFVFKTNPILFELLTQYIADKLQISPLEIKLIGSGKTGFSISPPPKFGRKFNENSDLDLVLINQKIFNCLKDEFSSWASQFESGSLIPQNLIERKYWAENLNTCPRTLNRGFIDSNKIPSYKQFHITQTINNSLFFIKKGLFDFQDIIIKKATIRIYNNWQSFTTQLKINTEKVLDNV